MVGPTDKDRGWKKTGQKICSYGQYWGFRKFSDGWWVGEWWSPTNYLVWLHHIHIVDVECQLD